MKNGPRHSFFVQSNVSKMRKKWCFHSIIGEFHPYLGVITEANSIHGESETWQRGDLASCSSKKNSIYCEILKRQVVEIKGLSHLRLASQMNNHTSDIAGSVVKKSADQKVFDGSTGGFCGHRQQGGGTNLGPKKTLQDLKLGTMRRYKPRQN